MAAAPAPEKHVSFTVLVSKSSTERRLGLRVVFDPSRGFLVVEEVKAEGLVPTENKLRLSRNQPTVDAGDFLVSVNGCSGEFAIMQREFTDSESLQLVFVKQP